MLPCPACGETGDVQPLVEAMRRDVTLRPSEFGWMMQAQWGSRPPQRAMIGTRRVADRVMGQLRRPSSGVLDAFSRIVGGIVGVAAALVGIPLFVVALVLLSSSDVWFFPFFLIAWLVGVLLLFSWATRMRAKPSPYGRAVARLGELSYCADCETIFETASGRVVPVERLHDALYAEGAVSESVNHLAHLP